MIWILAVVSLAIAPWTEANLQTTTAAAAKYRLQVTGQPNAEVHLAAAGVAKGWLAAFCTPKYCSPKHTDATLPASGKAVFAFELIRESDGAPKESGATITTSDGASIEVPTAHR